MTIRIRFLSAVSDERPLAEFDMQAQVADVPQQLMYQGRLYLYQTWYERPHLIIVYKPVKTWEELTSQFTTNQVTNE